jgi:hypothetical protein
VGDRGDAPWLARPALPSYAEAEVLSHMDGCNANADEHSNCWGSPELPYFETPPYLEEIVTWMAEESCGENFVLQPEIEKMVISEYRWGCYTVRKLKIVGALMDAGDG